MTQDPIGDLIDRNGMLLGIRFIPSPNFDERPQDGPVCLIVVHAISLPPGEFGGDAVEALFMNCLDPEAHPYFREIHSLRVSAHFLIDREGALTQYVSCDKRAWHAGASRWGERVRCNDFSIGIELEGCDEMPFEDAQYRALANLVNLLKRHYPIQDIVGHCDIAPGRKTDPGPYFDWQHLAKCLSAIAKA